MGKLVLSYDVRLRSDTGRFLAVYNAEMERAVAEAADYLATLATLYAPKRTGQLAGSIDAINFGKHAEVHAGADHALPQETGSVPHAIPNAFGTGMTVLHPGNPAIEYMRRASEASREFFVLSVARHFPG